ncbi:metallophosphoesterase [Vibrio parahaemolyticus]
MNKVITNKIIDIYETSDIHTENFNDLFPRSVFWSQFDAIKPIHCDHFNVLILAGDIFKLRKGVLAKEVVSELRNRFDLVLYVPGNHEYYNSNFDSESLKGIEKLNEIDGVFVLDNDEIILKGEDGEIAFIGSTLWTDIALNKEDADYVSEYLGQGTYRFRDFKAIRKKLIGKNSYARLKPIDQTLRHKECVLFLDETIEKHKNENRTVIVITHHSPSFKSASRFKKGTPIEFKDAIRKLNSEGIVPRLNPLESGDIDLYAKYSGKGTSLYCSNLDPLIKRLQPDFWFHGHIHEKIAYYIGDTLIQSDPFGYINRKELREVREQIPIQISFK